MNWKKYLLKSGLPFEYEVKECFVKHGATSWGEYSYIKPDENNVEKEFSYDIDVFYGTLNNYFAHFLVECKYKTEPTSWFFLPDPYSYQEEVHPNSFLHVIDHFTSNKFRFDHYPYYKIQDPLGPFCLKGVEVFQNQFLELNIFKAINQLSYAFIERVIDSIHSQISSESDIFSDAIYFNIPVIVTNAELRLINKNITTVDIENCSDIEDISEKHDFLFFHNKIGEDLRRYNFDKLRDYFTSIEEEKINERNKSFTNDMSHFVDVLSKKYCPEIILIMHHDRNHDNYDKLFRYINFLFKPSPELKEKVERVKEEASLEFKEAKERLEQFKKSKL